MNSNDNENIEVYDASILRSNEHPKFKIGDVINNGYGNFTVKGFTRSSARIAYALDNGHKLIGWLTEQVDAKFHLVENNGIKETPPKKIYLLPRQGGDYAPYWKTDSQDGFGIEYTLTDAFIEKALDYIENNIYNHYDGNNEYGICGGYVKKEEFIKNFKEYMKGE